MPNRWIASQAMPPMATIKSNAFKNAAMIDVLRSP